MLLYKNILLTSYNPENWCRTYLGDFKIGDYGNRDCELGFDL